MKKKYAEEKPEKDFLRNYITSSNLKLTRQRQFVLDVFLSVESHVSAEELYRLVAEKKMGIGIATVYRTLNLLTECGLAQKREFGDGQVRYEHNYNHQHHDHLICNKCRRIIEFENKMIEQLQEDIAHKHKFSVRSHRLELYGLCADCSE